MTKVSQHLWFEKDMEAAVRFYVETVPGSEMGAVTPVPAETPSGPEGSVKTVEFTLGGQRYMALEAGPLDAFNHSFSVMVECEAQDEIDRLWATLSQGGKQEPCGWLVDRWGLSWQIVPRMLGEAMTGADKAKAKRVTEAMLKMSKIDIATLERAAEGG